MIVYADRKVIFNIYIIIILLYDPSHNIRCLKYFENFLISKPKPNNNSNVYANT